MARKPNAHDILSAQRIPFGQALYTRGGLLRELTQQGYSEKFIDFHVWYPKALSDKDIAIQQFVNDVPNVIPDWYREAMEGE